MLAGILLLFALGMAGMVSRENNFEFAQEPQISGPVNGVYTITFATKAKCDATVAIIKGDLIVRHLASGVLGANAPYPFAKDALSQSLEWDGKDDVGNVAPEGCQVRVSLGLKASYAGEISDPYCFSTQGIITLYDQRCYQYGLRHTGFASGVHTGSNPQFRQRRKLCEDNPAASRRHGAGKDVYLRLYLSTHH